MRAVNLLPKDAGRSTRSAPKPVPLVAVVGGAAVAAGVGVLFMTTSGTLATKQDELANTQAQLAAVPKPAPPRATVLPGSAELAAQRDPRVAAVATALAERVSWDRVLRRFSLVLPDDVWLQTLSLTAPVAAVPVDPAVAQPAADAQGFSITGRTYSHEGVARLLSRMTALPDLENVQLQTSRLADVAGQDLVEFTIVAGVRADRGAS